MKQLIDNLSDMQKGTLISVAFHIILFVLFLIVESGVQLPDTEFAEIGFVSASRTSSSRTSRQAQPATQESQVAQEETEEQSVQQEPVEQAEQNDQLTQQDKVDLPKRRMLEDEEPQLSERRRGKLSPQSSEAGSGTTRRTPSREKEITDRSAGGSDKRFAEPGQSNVAGKQSPGPTSTVGGEGSNTPFTIEGEASQRQIISKTLPQYPSGLQREAVVKIRFTVLPDGRIGQMIPVKKSDPTLEDITMQALQNWRFNAIPESEEQKKVQGVITFIYKLE